MVAVLPVWVPPLAVAIVIALAAAFAWQISRPLLRAPEGPTLPERLQRWRGQLVGPIAIAGAAGCLSGRHALWAIPAVWLVSQAIQHQVRRRVFGDTWTLPAQLAWNLRALAGTSGFWWLTSLAPLAIVATDAPAWVGVAVGVVLLAWNHFYGDLVLAALGATPLRRPELDAVFEPVLARARVARPRVLRAGPRGARVANAFAMSSPRGDVVLFLDTLVESARPAELAGVLAHEIGHLEDFAARRWQLYAHGAILAVGAGALPVLLRGADLEIARWAVLVWFGVAIGSLLARAIRSQQRETDSDRRAVELCGGDGEALIGALVLLHELAQVPRRLDPDHEKYATHPGLGRRIRAIRTAAGAPPDLIQPCLIAAHEPTRAVVFERDRVVFVTAAAPIATRDPAEAIATATRVEAMPYADVGEIRVEPGRTDGTILVAATRAGTRVRTRIADAEVPALQAVLNAVDQRVAPAAPAPPAALGRLAAALAAMVLLLAGPMLSVVWSALAGLVKPTPPILAAIAAGSLVSAVQPGAHLGAYQATALVLVGLVCGLSAALRWRALQRGDRPFPWDGWLAAQIIFIALAALWPAWWIAALGRGSIADLHVAARYWANGAAGFVALGVCLALLPRRLARIGAALALAIGVALFAIASDAFRARYAPDPLIAEAPALAIDDLPAAPDTVLPLETRFASIGLGPGAAHVLLGQNPDVAASATTTAHGSQPDGLERTFVVAGFDGWRRAFTAREAVFVDADTLLVVRGDGAGTRLSAENVRDGASTWSTRLDAHVMEGIDADTSGRWRATTIDVDAGRAADDAMTPPSIVEGRVGESPSAGSTATASIVVTRRLRPARHPLWWMAPALYWGSDIARTQGGVATPLVSSRLAADCVGPTLASAAVTCLAQSADETFLWIADADGGALRPVARVPGEMLAVDNDAGTIQTWHRGDLLVLRAGERRALRLSRGDDCPCAYDAAARDGRLATLETTPGGGTRVAVYRVGTAGAAAR